MCKVDKKLKLDDAPHSKENKPKEKINLFHLEKGPLIADNLQYEAMIENDMLNETRTPVHFGLLSS